MILFLLLLRTKKELCFKKKCYSISSGSSRITLSWCGTPSMLEHKCIHLSSQREADDAPGKVAMKHVNEELCLKAGVEQASRTW